MNLPYLDAKRKAASSTLTALFAFQIVRQGRSFSGRQLTLYEQIQRWSERIIKVLLSARSASLDDGAIKASLRGKRP
jgi:hypothetical protein